MLYEVITPPGRCRQAYEVAIGDIEGHVVQRLDVHPALVVGLAKINAAYSRHGQTFVIASTGS